MTNLEKLQEAAKENKELSDALNMISGQSEEEVIQKVLETAHRFGFDLEEDDVIVQQALGLDELDQVAGGAYGYEAKHFDNRHDRSNPFYFSVKKPV